MLAAPNTSSPAAAILQAIPRQRVRGAVTAVRGNSIYARMPSVALGEEVSISAGQKQLIATVIAFSGDEVTLAPYGELNGITPGAAVVAGIGIQRPAAPRVSIGRILGALGEPIDNAPSGESFPLPLIAPPPPALSRPPIREQFISGVRALDLCLPLGYGQRIGLFAGPGVGKSTVLGMLARNAAVDVTVIGLIGERGREVHEFIDSALGPEGRARSVVVVATSDESSMRRLTAARTATAIAEQYRREGKRVLLLIDSLTRVARALREIGLAAGELPVRQGYTPSVFTELPKLLERPGNTEAGSITALYTVLSAGEFEPDPLGEEIKSLLDGHINLTQSLAQQGVRPAIDIVSSVSRVAAQVLRNDSTRLDNIRTAIAITSQVRRERDLILLGGKADRALAAAITADEKLRALLSQSNGERHHIQRDCELFARIVSDYRAEIASPAYAA